MKHGDRIKNDFVVITIELQGNIKYSIGTWKLVGSRQTRESVVYSCDLYETCKDICFMKNCSDDVIEC